MSVTRNGPNGPRLEGPPRPSRRMMAQARDAEVTRNGAHYLGEAPANEELARQLNSVFAEIAEADASPNKENTASSSLSSLFSQPLRTYQLREGNMRRHQPHAWLKRAISQDHPQSAPAMGWRKHVNSAAPLIAAGVLLSFYPAFRFVLNPSEPATETMHNVSSGKPSALSNAAQAPNLQTDFTQPIKVRTIRIVPGHPPSLAGSQKPAKSQPEIVTPTLPAVPPPAPPVAKAVSVPAVQSQQAVLRTPPITTASIRAETSRPIAHSTPSAEQGALMRRGEKLTAEGDIAGAQLAYLYLAQEGNAEAALALGKLNDPQALARLGVVGLAGNTDKALYWYKRAAELGNLDAARRLAQISSR